MTRRLLICALFIALCGCAREDATEQPSAVGPTERVYATFEHPATRTYLDEDNRLYWHAEDAISFFRGVSTNIRYTFEGTTGDREGSFVRDDASTATGATLDRSYALYPYAPSTAISYTGSIAYTLPASQQYAAGTFSRGVNVMMAATDNTSEVLSFKNCGGYLRLRLYGTDVAIRSVTLDGNMSEPLSGAATFSMGSDGLPAVAMGATAASSVTIECDEALTLGTSAEDATSLLFVLPPTTFNEGFTITITDDQGRTFTKATTKRVAIERNMIQPMAAFEVIFEEIPAANPFSEIKGTWALTSWRGATPSFKVYMDISDGGNITLWQKMTTRAWERYDSTATIDKNVISGTYSDGVAWSANYSIAIAGDTMTWTDTVDSTDVSVYTRTELPNDLPTDESNATRTATAERFL